MNALIQSADTMTSLQIAEVTGKLHKDVLEAIRTMEPAWEKITERKFPLSEYIDSTGRHLPMYKLTRTECLYVATKFNDEARARLVIRWEELERNRQASTPALPQTFAEALRLAAEQAERMEQQQKQIAEMQPKAVFADAVKTSDRSILIAELAKLLKQNGIDMGQNRLFHWLRSNGYLCSRGDYYNQPTQRAMEMGLFEVKKTIVNKPDGSSIVSATTKVSGKGQVYFVNKFLNRSSNGRAI